MPTAGLLISIILCIYPFVLYPALLRIWWRCKAHRQESPREWDGVPSVALIICALNERRIIREKIENCLMLDYPKDKLHIVVISDGSTDGTAGVVRQYISAGVQLIDQPSRRGKVANLNEVLPTRREDILALSDANVMYRPDSIRRLVARFADDRVGCVSGKVILTDSAPLLDSPTGQYYSLEWFLQEAGSYIYSMAGADGAMYALRRELFVPCPPDSIIEDFIIPMAVVRQGHRVVFEPAAVGWEQGANSVREEFRRKVRIAAGAVQSLVRGNGWPQNAPLRFWFVFVSHKLLRWLWPMSGSLTLAFAVASFGRLASQIVVIGFAVAAFLAIVRAVTRFSHPLAGAAFYFLFGQVATAWGLMKGITGRQNVLWAKVDR